MARIQQYHAQISSQTGAPSPIANPADFGVGMGDVGKTLDKVGDQATRIFDALEAKKERDADLWRAKTVAEETVNWTKTFTERELTADLGADGHTKRAIDDLEKRKTEVLAMAPTEASRARLEIDLTRLYGSFTAGAMGFEAKSSAAKNLSDVKETAGLHQNAVYMDPRRYEEAKNYVFELADSLGAGPNRPYGLPPAAVAEQKRVFEADLTAKMFEGRVDRAKTLGEVNGVLSELKGEHWQKVLPPAQYERLVTNATNAGKQIEARNEQLAMSSFSAAIQVAETGTPTKRPNFEMVSDPARRAQLIKQWDGANAVGEIARQTKLTSPSEDMALLQKARAGTASSDPEAQLQALRQQDAIIKAVTTKRKLLETDPAAYAKDNVPSVGAAYKAYEAAPSEKTRQNYVAETKAAQRNLGIPADQTTLLTGDQVAQYRAQMDSVPRTPEGAAQAHDILTGFHRDYGSGDSQLVYRQLAEQKVISGVELVAARMTDRDQRQAAVALLRANAEGEKELLKLIPSEEKAKPEIERQVGQAMMPLAATLNNSIGGVTAANDTAAAARVLATKYVTQGMSIADAAQRAVKETATGKYNFAGAYRVPVVDHDTGKPLNHYDVSAGASRILRDASSINFALPRSMAGLNDKYTKDSAAQSLQSFGSWITDEGERGLVLTWPTGERVTRADGKGPIRYTWQELLEASAGRADGLEPALGGP